MKILVLLMALMMPVSLLAQDSLKTDSVEMQKHRYKKKRNPAAAGLLSFVIPGTGQVYNKQYGKAAIFFVGWAGGVILGIASVDVFESSFDAADGIGFLLFFGSWLGSIIDATKSAKKINARYNLSIRMIPNTLPSDNCSPPVPSLTYTIPIGR